MTLAKPTGLIVQGLNEFATLEQSVQRVTPAHDFATLEQWTGGARPGGVFATLEQSVQRVTAAHDFATLRQRTGYRLTPAHDFATLRQRVVFLRVTLAHDFAVLDQRVQRVTPAHDFAALRQLVTAETQGQTPRPRFLIRLDGVDITARCRYDITISASEGDNRTCQVILRAQPGPLNIPGFKGKALHIDRLQGGELVPLFRGWVDVPTYDRVARTVTLRGSDLRGERLGREDRARLRSLTGGLYSPVTQREDATGEAWVRELLRTVPGSLDYTSAGTLRYRPWALATPRYTLAAGQINADRVNVVFDTRSESVNTVRATLEYRYYQRNTFTQSVTMGMRKALKGIPLPGDTIPTRDALRSAIFGVPNWHPVSYTILGITANGWYKSSPTDINPLHFFASDALRKTHATGVDATLERYISQPKRERYELTFSAPESVDQFGEIAGSDMRFSLETRVDPAVFEERGCTVVADPDDRRADLEAAIEAVQRMVEKMILEGHRRNYATFLYKPKTGRAGHRELLPVEIGDTLAAPTTEVDVTGWVSAFTHRQDDKGDIWTEIRLAMSRVDSEVSVTEDWSLPAPPSKYALNPDSAAIQDEPTCPVIEDDETIDLVSQDLPRVDLVTGEPVSPSHISPDGSVVVVMPEIGRSQVDEIIGQRTHQYDIAIPTDPISVEVPND
ncbi:hypothetical protein MKP05_09355 [Halomonas sp. EGI 63088]|uniref:Uncharacterized protein n=1 Tax=Halomonas flagellata TaxID=2920385 RepID=A0ABS9RU27_9GAMM|nr:hypothetical protein [Halomonas flagellata]MCH4563335.1 hypothetical protein [Halomonas flagellata]